MRISGGEKRGHKLARWRGEGIRPLRDRVRMALFSKLGEAVAGAEFLDLFSGTGAVGLEALSRGAARATLVDSSPQAVSLCVENAARLGYTPRVEIVQADVRQALVQLARNGRKFDLVFIGAPYATDLAKAALSGLAKALPLRPGAIIVAETFHKDVLPDTFPPLVLTDSRRYGETRLTYFRFGPKRGTR